MHVTLTTGHFLSCLLFFQIYRNKRAQQRKFLGIHFLGTSIRENIDLKISTVGLFCCDKRAQQWQFLGLYFLGLMFRENICLKISAVGRFCCDKFEKTTNKKVSGRQSCVNLTLVEYQLKNLNSHVGQRNYIHTI